MSKRYATVSALLGMAAGALLASPYLEKATECAADQPAFSCSLNNSVGPFVGAILLGFVLGIAIGRNGQKAWQRWGPGAQDRDEEADAVAEVASSAGAPAPDRLTAAPAEPAAGEQSRAEVTLGSRGRPRPVPRTRD